MSEVLLPLEQIMTNLSSRDLESCIRPIGSDTTQAPKILGMDLYDSRYVGRVLEALDRKFHGRRESPTFDPFQNEEVDNMYFTLAEKGVIKPRTASDIQDGFFHIPYLKQLSTSQLPAETVFKLSAEGFGVWPVKSGLDISGPYLKELKLELTTDQKRVLHSALIGVREINGLWFQDERLVSKHKPLEGDYLPTLAEILSAFDVFHHQEGFFPHSNNRWLVTRSSAAINLESAYRNSIYEVNPLQILIAACIHRSTSANEVRGYLASSGDFRRARSGGGLCYS